MVRSPWQAASATLALKSGEWVLLFRLIASLLSISLILREALTAVQSLSSQWGPSIIQLATNKDNTPTQHKWVTDDEGKQTKVEVTKRVKRWLTASVDGKINLVVRYGSKPLEFAKGKNAIELNSEAEVADTLRKVREAAELGELDALIEQQAQFGRRLTLKNK